MISSQVPISAEDDIAQLKVCDLYRYGRWVSASSLALYSGVSDDCTSYVPSEGAAAVVLKTKTAAIRDGDKILAVVRSTAIMHDGRSQGLVAPNVKAQIAMQRSLMKHANLYPAQVE